MLVMYGERQIGAYMWGADGVTVSKIFDDIIRQKNKKGPFSTLVAITKPSPNIEMEKQLTLEEYERIIGLAKSIKSLDNIFSHRSF